MWGPPVLAQAIPGTARPGAVEQRLQQALPVQHENRIEIPSPQGFGTPLGAEKFHFTLRHVEVRGATAISSSQIAATYASLVGHDVTLAQIFEVARAITGLYTQAGYALSFALVPAQEVDPATGTVRIDVVEGYVSDIQYQGDTRGISRLANDYSAAVLASRPLRTAALERFLLLLNDVPGYTVNGVFDAIPNSPKGATRLIVRAASKPVMVSAEADNRGSRAFGPYEASATVQLNSLLGQGDSLLLHGLRALNANELSAAVGQFTLPLGYNGLTFTLDGTYTDAHPGSAQLAALKFASSGWTTAARLSYPLIRTRADSLWVWGGVAGKWLHSSLLTAPNSRDHLYELQAGATYNERDPSGFTTLDGTLTQGLDIFDATTGTDPLRSRAAGSGQFTALTATLSRTQSLAQTGLGAFDFYDAVSGQIASRGLLTEEQCGYGGASFGRAYDPNEIMGDHCLMNTAELRLTPTGSLSPFDNLQFFVAFDAGEMWDSGTLGPGDKRNDGGASAGLGMRFALFQKLSGSVEFDQPIGHGIALENNDRAGRVFFQLSLAN